MQMLVIGLGEVGKSLKKVLEQCSEYEVFGIDYQDGINRTFDVIHICFPYKGEEFVNVVKVYQQLYLRPDGLTIIHSTVPVGTSAKVDAVHSPIRGVHPNLVEGIRTFTKYFGGPQAERAARLFKPVCREVFVTEKSETIEALKLWDTTYYGWNIAFMKAVKKYCDEKELDFDVIYGQANIDYNDGYEALGRSEVRRPVLKFKEGKIGGHCVIPNCHLLGGGIAEFILSENERY